MFCIQVTYEMVIFSPMKINTAFAHDFSCRLSFCFVGIHYVGKMIEGDMTRVLVDQITEGQVTWVPMDKEFDTVSTYAHQGLVI